MIPCGLNLLAIQNSSTSQHLLLGKGSVQPSAGPFSICPKEDAVIVLIHTNEIMIEIMTGITIGITMIVIAIMTENVLAGKETGIVFVGMKIEIVLAEMMTGIVLAGTITVTVLAGMMTGTAAEMMTGTAAGTRTVLAGTTMMSGPVSAAQSGPSMSLSATRPIGPTSLMPTAKSRS